MPTILADLTTLSREDLIAQVLALQTSATSRITFKVSPKGAISMYGLGRFPITLYAAQWERLASAVPALTAFAKTNASLLSVKPPKETKV